LGLGNGSWDLGQGLVELVTGNCKLVTWGVPFDLFWFSFRQGLGQGLEPFCIPSKHFVANKPFVYWIRFEKLFLVSFLLVFVS
jgi:hypothetical protein